MKDHSPHKINNSYESPSSGSATSSSSNGDVSAHRFMNLDFNHGYELSSLILSYRNVGTDYEMYNTSAEEGIFPNVRSTCPVAAPSYEPEYDYYNQYSTAPLVYSWMPIVPGFTPECSDNLHKFDHLVKKVQPHPLNISSISTEGNSSIISDQNVKFANSLVLNNSDSRHYNILNNSSGMTFNHQLDDSCNAMDLNISCNILNENNNQELSFNGKIPELTTTASSSPLLLNNEEIEKTASSSSPVAVLDECVNIANEQDDKQECINNADESENENEKLRNESFELLKQEDSTKMLFINENEKSPVMEYQDESDDQEDAEIVPVHSHESINLKCDNTSETKIAINTSSNTIMPTLKDRDDFLLKKFQSSLSELRPPPSIATLPLSLSEMIAIYKRNLDKPKESFTPVQSNSMFVPSHPFNETKSMEWPQITEVKAHGIIYNRSTDCEQIEFMTVKYVERFIKAETTSSYNHKVGPSSAKKKIEKLKLLTQSPSSRLSHLANRRKIFSSANLKSTSATTSHKTFATSKQLLVDKSKLYQKKKRASAKKKTPGKRKTPRSTKRQNLQSVMTKPESAVSSKRALFISPMKSRNDTSTLSRLNRELPTRGQLPKRTLFSPPQNAKRKRSPSPDDENKYGKSRRLDSPSKMLKSKSFSIAPASSSGSLDEHFKKTLYYRTQSEAVLNQSIAGSSKSSTSTIGFRKAFSDTEKKKLLWTASSALQSKQVNRDHEKFKEYMSTLCKLVKKIFTEFYNPTKSMSAQMTKFSNLMVFYVIQGRSFDEIYLMTKNKLEAQNPTKVSGYIGQEDYQKNHFIRKNSSLLLMTNSCSSFSINSDSLLDSTFDKSGSDTSLNRSTSKNSEKVLRENFSNNARDNSTKKLFSVSETNLNTLKTSTPSSQVLKAKRQISF